MFQVVFLLSPLPRYIMSSMVEEHAGSCKLSYLLLRPECLKCPDISPGVHRAFAE